MSGVVDLSEKKISRRNGETYRIGYGGFLPKDAADNTRFHQSLIDDMTDEAGRIGWAGAAFADYASRSGYVSVAIVRGDGWPSLDDLRAFRERQKQAVDARAAEQREQPAQGSLV
jgi:hypothetical protein